MQTIKEGNRLQTAASKPHGPIPFKIKEKRNSASYGIMQSPLLPTSITYSGAILPLYLQMEAIGSPCWSRYTCHEMGKASDSFASVAINFTNALRINPVDYIDKVANATSTPQRYKFSAYIQFFFKHNPTPARLAERKSFPNRKIIYSFADTI